MIKIVAIEPVGAMRLDLTFSDSTHGIWSAADLIARDTALTRPLTDTDYFVRAFIEAGALAWPNGLELSPNALHQRLDSEGRLARRVA